MGLGYPNNRQELEKTDPKETTELKIMTFGDTAANLPAFSQVSWEEKREGLCFLFLRPQQAELHCRAGGLGFSLKRSVRTCDPVGDGVSFIKVT